MKPTLVFSFVLVLTASVHAGTRRVVRQTSLDKVQQSQTAISMEGASEAIGIGGAMAEHESAITVEGSPDTPAQFSFSTGSDAGLSQSANNYQQSLINSDNSSQAYQGNSASNNGYATDFLAGEAQGVNVDVASNGWSAVEGEGSVGQIDILDHQGTTDVTTPVPAQNNSGKKKPQKPSIGK